MRALKCDRCGKLYEFYEGVERPDGKKAVNTMHMLDKNLWQSGKDFIEFDLCPSCMETLVSWVNNLWGDVPR